MRAGHCGLYTYKGAAHRVAGCALCSCITARGAADPGLLLGLLLAGPGARVGSGFVALIGLGRGGLGALVVGVLVLSRHRVSPYSASASLLDALGEPAPCSSANATQEARPGSCGRGRAAACASRKAVAAPGHLVVFESGGKDLLESGHSGEKHWEGRV